MGQGEFTDPGTVLVEFAGEVLVVCPSCRHRASIVPWPPPPSTAAERRLFGPRRLVCSHCPYHADWSGQHVSIGGDADPWFGHALWLRTPVRGHTLWAWNERHLDLLDGVAAARLRTRPDGAHTHQTLADRLPGWIKASRNREAVQQGIERLRGQLTSAEAAGHSGVMP